MIIIACKVTKNYCNAETLRLKFSPGILRKSLSDFRKLFSCLENIFSCLENIFSCLENIFSWHEKSFWRPFYANYQQKKWIKNQLVKIQQIQRLLILITPRKKWYKFHWSINTPENPLIKHVLFNSPTLLLTIYTTMLHGFKEMYRLYFLNIFYMK